MKKAMLVLGMVVAGGCSSGTEIDCSTVDPFPYSILVTVVFPPGTMGPFPEPGGTVTGSGTSQAMMLLPSSALASTVPMGTYDVEVTAQGYQPWTASDVTTEAGICGGFVPVELTAELVTAVL